MSVVNRQGCALRSANFAGQKIWPAGFKPKGDRPTGPRPSWYAQWFPQFAGDESRARNLLPSPFRLVASALRAEALGSVSDQKQF